MRATIVRQGGRSLRVFLSEGTMPVVQRHRLERAGFTVETAQPLRVASSHEFAGVVGAMLERDVGRIRAALARAAGELGDGARDVLGPIEAALEVLVDGYRARAALDPVPADLGALTERAAAALDGLRGAR